MAEWLEKEYSALRSRKPQLQTGEPLDTPGLSSCGLARISKLKPRTDCSPSDALRAGGKGWAPAEPRAMALLANDPPPGKDAIEQGLNAALGYAGPSPGWEEDSHPSTSLFVPADVRHAVASLQPPAQGTHIPASGLGDLHHFASVGRPPRRQVYPGVSSETKAPILDSPLRVTSMVGAHETERRAVPKPKRSAAVGGKGGVRRPRRSRGAAARAAEQSAALARAASAEELVLEGAVKPMQGKPMPGKPARQQPKR